MRTFPASLFIAFTLLLCGCQSTYYSAMEKLGYEKRDILIERVEDARDAQEETKEVFADTLEEFSALINFEGGELEALYDRLKASLSESERAAAGISARVNSIESVAEALFEEWQEELEQYSSANLRQASAAQLENTRDRYEELLATMRRAEGKIVPVLSAFRDQVLFLKHNLNAQAIASLDLQAEQIQSDVAALIAEMEAAIDEANAFIQSMK